MFTVYRTSCKTSRSAICFLGQDLQDLQDFMNAVFFVGLKILLILLILSKRGFASASINCGHQSIIESAGDVGVGWPL